MPTIKQLPASLVNKIAAGEVIERPASVVKELMENSVDAGASRLELTIEGGGMELIRLSDDGCGIDADQVPLALASHATSKLETAEDLFEVRTLGFRGEALASIAEISHLTLRTRTADSDTGCEAQVRGGVVDSIHPAGCPTGTTIEVRNLFFNTPVRRKFLRTPQTESNHVVEAFTRIALAFPQVQMKLISGSRTTFELPPTQSWTERIRAFFGDEIADSLIAVDSVQDSVRLTGFVADPSVSRSNNRMQYLFLNGRHIRDRSLQHALGEAYRGLLMTGRFPVCFLNLNLPPESVDVNVHPTKMEVRFLEGGKLYSQLLQTLRHQFLTTDLTARARHVPGPMPAGLRDTPAAPVTSQSAFESRSPSGARSEIPSGDQWPARATFQAAASGEPLPPLSADEQRWQRHSDQMSRVDNAGRLDLRVDIPSFRPFESSENDRLTRLATPPVTPSAQPQTESAEPPSRSHSGIQVHNRYLVTQDEQGMVVVDQHALHERILYEQLRRRTEEKNLESQQLLIPEPIDLTPTEAAAALEHRELLAKIGIEVEAFGGDTILMTSYPAMLANMRPAEVLRQVLEPLMAGGQEPSAREVLDELLHMLACKAAIKAGDRLSPEEITELLEQRYHFQDTHHCPHGRPTALHFSREQLDKMFKRT
jgi:DNA mismatch repair protein MutL